MANPYVEPTFATQDDWLTFLGIIRGVTITSDTLLIYNEKLMLKPEKTIQETSRDYRKEIEDWKLSMIYSDPALYALWKWDSYRLGKVRDSVYAYVKSIGGSPKTEDDAREMVRLQLEAKWIAKDSKIDVNKELLMLVTGIVW